MSDDLRFDQLLQEDAAALPPPAEEEVTPWQEAMQMVLCGIGLTTITLRVLYLHIILPAVGAMLLVLGFRTLRRENRPLGWCYGLAIAAAALRGVNTVLAALPVDTGNAMAYGIMVVTMALYICLWRGMVAVSRSAGAKKPAAPAAGALAVFYAVMSVLAYIGLEGWLLVLPLLAVYIMILRNLVKLSRSLTDTGYAIHAAQVRLPGWTVLWSCLGLTLAAVLLAMLLGQRHPMDWQPQDDAPRDAAIRQELLTLGFPEEVLDDLTAEEIARMAGAKAVFVNADKLYNQTEYREIVLEHYLGEDPLRMLRYDRTITTKHDDGTRSYTYIYRAFDTLEQTMTHVAVELPEEQEGTRYIVLHHLRCEELPKSRYTEGLTIWPVWQGESQWTPGTWYSGRVLCTRQGQAQTAALHGLEYADRTVTSFFGTQRQATVTAQWTRPAGGEDVRAYVLYDALLQTDGGLLSSWATYSRQTAPVYPFRDASTLAQSWEQKAVEKYQCALQVWLDGDEAVESVDDTGE